MLLLFKISKKNWNQYDYRIKQYDITHKENQRDREKERERKKEKI